MLYQYIQLIIGLAKINKNLKIANIQIKQNSNLQLFSKLGEQFMSVNNSHSNSRMVNLVNSSNQKLPQNLVLQKARKNARGNNQYQNSLAVQNGSSNDSSGSKSQPYHLKDNIYSQITQKKQNPQQSINQPNTRANFNNPLNSISLPSSTLNTSPAYSTSNSLGNHNNIIKDLKKQNNNQSGTVNQLNKISMINNAMKTNNSYSIGQQIKLSNNINASNMFQNTTNFNNKQQTISNISFKVSNNNSNLTSFINNNENKNVFQSNNKQNCNTNMNINQNSFDHQNCQQVTQFNENLQNYQTNYFGSTNNNNTDYYNNYTNNENFFNNNNNLNTFNNNNTNYQNFAIGQNKYFENEQNLSNQYQYDYQSQQCYQQNYNNINPELLFLNYEVQKQIQFTYNKYLALFQQKLYNPEKFIEKNQKQQRSKLNWISAQWMHDQMNDADYWRRRKQEKKNMIKVYKVIKPQYRRQNKRILQNFNKFYQQRLSEQQRDQQKSKYDSSFMKNRKKRHPPLRWQAQIKQVNEIKSDIKKQQIIEPEVSDFGSIVNLEYQVDLRWLEEDDLIIKKFKKSTVKVTQRPTIMEIDEAITLDLHKQGFICNKDSILQMNECQHKKITPNIFFRLFGYKQVWTKDFYYIGSIFQRKVKLPQGYDFTPRKFQGFIVKDFTVMNKFGKVQWEGETNLQKINWMEGIIQITEFGIQCTIKQLQKQAVFQLYSLPLPLRNQISSKQISIKLKKLAQRSPNAKFIGFNPSARSWKVKINFGKEQFEEKQKKK